MRETIYVCLLNEGTDVWAPVEADHEHDDIYRIVSLPLGDAKPQFAPGSLVRCQYRRLSGGDFLAAVRDVLG